jgi:hypothetical protein
VALARFSLEPDSGQVLSSINPSIRTFGVAEYRAYTVGLDGHFVGFEAIVCDTDDEAIERANRMLRNYGIEVWCADRMVAKLKSEPVVLRRENNAK